MGDARVALILLAAGRGARFGGDKLRANFHGRPLWHWSVAAADAAGFDNRYLVVAPSSPLTAPEGWHRVVNPRAAEGMGTSIAAGVAAAASGHRRVVVTLADMPLVDADHLQRLAGMRGAVFTRQEDGGQGAPAGFDADSFAALMALDGERGARTLALPSAALVDPSSPAMLADVDTPCDLASIERGA